MRNDVGASPSAILEINAFRIKGDPEVLNVQAVKKFLLNITGADGNESVQIEDLQWISGDEVEPGYEDTVNNPDGSDPIDQELRVMGTVAHTCGSKTYRYPFGTHYSGGDEYLGNSEEHSIVIRFEPKWNETMPIGTFVEGATALQSLKRWIVKRNRTMLRKITAEMGVVTT